MIYLFVYLFQWHQHRTGALHPRLLLWLTSFQTLLRRTEGRNGPGSQPGGVGGKETGQQGKHCPALRGESTEGSCVLRKQVRRGREGREGSGALSCPLRAAVCASPSS